MRCAACATQSELYGYIFHPLSERGVLLRSEIAIARLSRAASIESVHVF
jgi:hypothetical protein